MLALVSARTGVPAATAIVAITRFGFCGSSSRSVTSPTRMPLNSTADADQHAGDGVLEADAVDRALAQAAGVVQPVDEAEHRAR